MSKLGAYMLIAVLALMFVCGAIMIFWIPINKHNLDTSLKAEGDTTSCVITKIRGNYHRYSFNVNSDTFTSKWMNNPFKGISTGEMYQVVYVVSDISENVVLYKKPVLDKSIDYIKTDCIAIKEHGKRLWGDRTVAFEYMVNGQLYTRKQRVDESLVIYDTGIKEYQVFYNSQDPTVAYLKMK